MVTPGGDTQSGLKGMDESVMVISSEYKADICLTGQANTSTFDMVQLTEQTHQTPYSTPRFWSSRATMISASVRSSKA